MNVFKTCACGVEYKTEKEFKAKCDFVGNWDRFGLALWNCTCKSTITIEIFKGSKEQAKQIIIKEREEKSA